MAKKVAKKIEIEEVPTPSIMGRLLWVILAGAWFMLVASLLSFSPGDWPSHAVRPHNDPPVNWCGTWGAWIAYQLYFTFGQGVWVSVAAMMAYLLTTAVGRIVDQLLLRLIGVLMLTISTSSFLSIVTPSIISFPEGSGGVVAIALVTALLEQTHELGTFSVIAMLFGMGCVLAIDHVVIGVPLLIVTMFKQLAEKFNGVEWPKPALVGWATGQTRGGSESDDEKIASAQQVTVRRGGLPIQDPDINQPVPPAGLPSAPATMTSDLIDVPDTTTAADRVQAIAEDQIAAEQLPADDDEESDQSVAVVTGPAEMIADDQQEEEEEPAKPANYDPEAIKRKIRNLPIGMSKPTKNAPIAPREQDLSGYKFPPMDILIDPEDAFCEKMEKMVRKQAEELETALQTYKVDAEVVAIDTGPVVTLFEIQLAPGTKVSRVNSVASDIARSLKAQNIRVVPNTAGKSTVGIEVPNAQKEKVRLKELFALAGPDVYNKMRLPMFLGKDGSGNPLIEDMAKMPHMLIAGTTGSGKSVCMNTIVMSFLYTKRPDELKLVLVDPKMVEMSQFKDVPHLMCPVVTDMDKAAAILEWAVVKMDERYELLAEVGVRDIDSYNKFSWEELKEILMPGSEEEEARIPKKMPRMVFIIDELADLMMTNKEVEGYIVRIAQKARAVGMHLILATQRPSANVVTGLIKSNMPCRCSFKVASAMDSRIVLDQKGAELLLGQGDMLFFNPRNSKLIRSQGTLVDDKEVRASARFLKDIALPSFEPQLVQIKQPGLDGDAAERDPLFNDAVEVVLQSQRGSVSLLQRRLTVGYSRASRLIEQIAEAGIIGEYKGSQAREVNMTLEEWELLKEQIEQEDGGDENDAFENEQDDAAIVADEELEAGDVIEVEAPIEVAEVQSAIEPMSTGSDLDSFVEEVPFDVTDEVYDDDDEDGVPDELSNEFKY